MQTRRFAPQTKQLCCSNKLFLQKICVYAKKAVPLHEICKKQKYIYDKIIGKHKQSRYAA